jgi:hypothetical protein
VASAAAALVAAGGGDSAVVQPARGHSRWDENDSGMLSHVPAMTIGTSVHLDLRSRTSGNKAHERGKQRSAFLHLR